MSNSSTTTSASALTFIITGGGISGLTCAYLLRRSGHDVIVLEKSSRKAQVTTEHGGVRIPPNMMRLLQELPGTEELLKTKASKCAGIMFHQCKDNERAQLVGQMIFAQEIMDDLGCDFYFIPHKDLHEYLYALCLNKGVDVRHEFDVAKVETSKLPSVGPRVFNTSGDSVTGDIIIGADGKNSAVRQFLLAEQEEAEEADSSTEYGSEKSSLSPVKAIVGATLSIPVSLLRSDPELKPFLGGENHWMVYMGNGTSIAMAEYGPDLYLIDLTYGQPPLPEDEDEDWLSNGSTVESVLNRAREYDPRVQKILALGQKSHWNIQTVYDLQRYVSELNQVVVIGDAAHSIYINGTQNTAASFEDAFTLGRLFSRYSSKSNASFLLNGYNQIQQQRTRAMEKSEMSTMLLLGIPPGSEREGRNNGFRLTLNLDGADDETLERVWAGYVAQFNYDARDAVDEWWMTWARPGNRDSSIVGGVSVISSAH
ncbi:hypothetical protein FB446DRAFT_788456 [Lentinula raphanica]|uniref:FAD-binding domain-containing protein n=1 Tax=Lentinula raphanica TaxID=153919 RepID=A0AA38PLK9_9AGAR|nr:hypothetical protein FB446DRAFT_788456 [Lentinula raphanica]KAJ3845178.1 hypothetical protein F5878DRAFT_357507 [Lentinula raphanica]